MWIHEDQNWPNFTWDAEALASKLADTRHRQERLLGRMEAVGFELRPEAILSTLTNDVFKSVAIEGENVTHEEVWSSIARPLGIDIARSVPASRDVEGIIINRMLEDDFKRQMNASKYANLAKCSNDTALRDI